MEWHWETKSEEETREVGGELASKLKAGDVVFLHGELGAGKTTLVRGLLAALGHSELVRSPTFNLIQLFETKPPVMHTDLYRVKSHEGIGLEDHLATHLCLIEWPERAASLIADEEAWHVIIEFTSEGRRITARSPQSPE